VIAAAKPRRSIGRGENSLDLGARQEVHLSLVVALARYGEHALNQCVSAWKKDPVRGVIGVQKGPL
jgi:hypothetical protein